MKGARFGAFWVALGILLSRIAGLLRTRVFAYYLGNSPAAAAFSAASRIPNALQNLLGEGVLSASFVPVYAGLREQGDTEGAERVAGAVSTLLFLASSVVVLLGWILARPAVALLLGGGDFHPELRELVARLVQLILPGVALLVMSAWCLGVLNSHRRFLLSYASPVLWNAAIVVALLMFGGKVDDDGLVRWVAWGMVAGSALQLGAQLPGVLQVLRLRPNLALRDLHVQRVLKSFFPVLVGRGVVQLSAYVDLSIAARTAARAVAALTYCQTVSLLPVSLFGMAVSASELPELARTRAGAGDMEAARERMASRLRRSVSRVAFLVIPSAVAFVLLGDVVAGALFQTGAFDAGDSRYTWYLLMGSAIGLLSSTLGRLYASVFYAMHDTWTPLWTSLTRVLSGTAMAAALALGLAPRLGLHDAMSAVGVTAGSGLAATLEFQLLRRALRSKWGITLPPGSAPLSKLWLCAGTAGLLALGLKALLARRFGVDSNVLNELFGRLLGPPRLNPIATAAGVLGLYGLAYFGLTAWAGIEEAKAVLSRLSRRR